MNTSTPPHTPFPAAGTAEGRFVVPLSTLPPTAGISFEVWKQIHKKARRAAEYLANKEKVSKQLAEYYAKNKIKIKEQQAIYYAENRARIALREAAYRAANKEKVAESKKRYAKSNKEKLRKYMERYQAANKEKLAENKARYSAENKEKIANYHANRQRTRLKTDPLFRLSTNLRCRMRLAFKSQSARKSQSTVRLVGCSKDELRQHLVSQFREGMTLENHGKVWHIDHIRPCASFDLSDPNQAILCFHYSNLQPLFADENLRKSDRWEPTEIRPLAA
jgi:hypothetical protein